MWKREKDLKENGVGGKITPTGDAGSIDLVPNEPTVDAVWGEVAEDGPNYRSLGWIRAAVLMCKLNFGLGILAIPSVLHTLGFVPGILCIIAIAVITSWSNYVLGIFKMNHPEVANIADVGYILFGAIGRELLGGLFWILMIMLSGSTLLSISIAFNAFTAHATCTVVYVVVAAVVVALLASIQTMHKLGWVGWVGLVCLMTAVIAVTIAVGVQERPNAAPQTGPWDPEVRAFANPSLIEAMNAISLILCVISELRRPELFNKSALYAQGVITVFYLVIGSVVYAYAGRYVSSPALGLSKHPEDALTTGTAGLVMKKVCYAIALPGLFASGILLTHVAAKYIFLRLLQGSPDLSRNTIRHYIYWFGSVIITTALAFIVAESIPFFSSLVGLIGALLVSAFTLILMGGMWYFDNYHSSTKHTLQNKLLFGFNTFVVLSGFFVMVTGTWGAAVDIRDLLNAGDTTSPFSCRDNSGS